MVSPAAALTVALTLLLSAASAPAESNAAPEPRPVPPAAEGGPVEPVTLIALTDDAGRRTEVATDGLETVATDVTSTESAATAAAVGGGGWRGGLGAAVSVSAPPSVAPEPPGNDVAILTAPIATDEFLVAGVTWEAGAALPAGTQVFLRVLEDGGWSSWLEAQVEEGATAEDSGTSDGRTGTDPFVTGGAQAVQIQVTGSADGLPAGLELSLIPANPAPADDVISEPEQAPEVAPEAAPPPDEPVATAPEAAPPSAEGSPTSAGAAPARVSPALFTTPASELIAEPSAAVVTPGSLGSPTAGAVLPAAVTGQPNVITRAGWGADESLMTWTPRYSPLKAAVVHHTAGTNTYSAAQSPSIVRGIYYYHAVTRDWGDIGYNFLVDKYGQIFEGRRGSIAAADGSMTIGAHAAPFNTNTLGIAAMGDYTQVGVPQVILDRMAEVISWKFGRADIDVTTPSGLISPGTPALPAGRNLPRIFGHRDVSSTACPGNDIYSRIAAMTRDVENRLSYLYYLNNSFTGSADIKLNYGSAADTAVVGDWDGNGTDTLGVRRSERFYLRNSNTSGMADTVVAYGNPGDEIFIGDWNGDGKDSFAVRRGNTFYLRNSMTSGVAETVISYGNPGDVILVGDWDGDGKDTFTVRRGARYYVKNAMTTGVADTVILYGNPEDTILVGDWNADRIDTLAVRRGITYYLKNSLSTGTADVVFAYGNHTDRHLVGDWNGDGLDTLGIRRP